ncbi:MAG: hypothetical protein ABEL76_07645 [Bradymonadaceae bacterium]
MCATAVGAGCDSLFDAPGELEYRGGSGNADDAGGTDSATTEDTRGESWTKIGCHSPPCRATCGPGERCRFQCESVECQVTCRARSNCILECNGHTACGVECKGSGHEECCCRAKGFGSTCTKGPKCF